MRSEAPVAANGQQHSVEFCLPTPEVVLIRERNHLVDIEEFIYGERIRHVFIDTETTGLDPYSDDLALIQVMGGTRCFLIRPHEVGTGQPDDFVYWGGIVRILKDPEIVKVFHNAKFDLKFLKRRLFDGCYFEVRNLFDTYIAEQILTAGISVSGDHALERLVKKYLEIDLDKSVQNSFEVTGELTHEQVRYAVEDVRVLEPIFRKQTDLLVKTQMVDVALLEFSIVPAIADIELKGVLLDLEKLKDLKKVLTSRVRELERELKAFIAGTPEQAEDSLFDEPDINLRSPVQVKQILSRLGFEVESTGTETLERINHPFPKLMVEHRRASKLLSSFVDKLPKHVKGTGRIHPEFFQLGTEAGRFSCQKPNLQQIPKEQEWRDLFVAPPGYKLITADYSQIELRILAEFSKDPAFIEAYRTGQDLHSRTASEIFSVPLDQVTKDQRNVAKTINFGLCYGMSASGLSNRLDIPIAQAEGFINAYFRAYPMVRNTLQRLGTQAIAKGYSETLSGRKRYYRHPDSFSKQKSLERKGRNTPIQGTCGDILKKAIQYLAEDLVPYDAKIINLVHDEILVEVSEEEAQQVKEVMRKSMIRAGEDFIITIPVQVDIAADRVWRK